MSEWEKKSDALARKSQYEASLKTTMLRIRGSFADVILGVKKEIQGSIDKSFEMKTSEMELSLEKQFAKRMAEKDKVFAKMSVEMEQKISSAEKESSRLSRELRQSEQTKTVAQAQLADSTKAIAELEKQAANQREYANAEIARLRNELNRSTTQMSESEQKANMVQAQLSQERESYRQKISIAESGRDDAIHKLSSTLETLQTTCANAQVIELQLAETEEKLKKAEDKLQYVEHERRQEQDNATQQWNIEHERTILLQKKLDSETKNKHALINVQKEMEQHLSLERERADLLQQELQSVNASKEEMVQSLQEAERQRRDELKRASHENKELRDHMKNELDNASQEHAHLREQIERASEMNSSLKANLNDLQAKFEEQESEYSQLSQEFVTCKNRLDKTSEMNSLLEAKVERLEEKVQDQVLDLEAARMSEAEVENSLSESLQRSDELEAKLRLAKAEMQQRVEALETRLRRTINEMQSLTEQITDECTQKAEKVAQLEDAKRELENLGTIKSEVESERDDLRRKLGNLEKDHEALCNLNIGLEATADELKEKLSKVEGDYGEDRERISKALQGFDEEITNAEVKLKGVMDELEKEKMKVKELTDAQASTANQNIVNEDLHKKELDEERKKHEVEKNTLTEEISKVKAEAYKKSAKHEADVGVYAEAIKMLQKQVDILGEMVDSAECEKCANVESDDKRFEVLRDLVKEEAKQELLAKIDEQKREHDISIKSKEADIADLREKCEKRGESMAKLEDLCIKARKELIRVRRHVEMRSQDEIHDAANAIEVVSTPRSSSKKTTRFQDGDYYETCTNDITANGKRGLPTSCRDIGSELDALLVCIEAQLGIGSCTEDEWARRIGHDANR